MQGTSQAPEECALPERMKEGRRGVRCRRPPGRVRKPGWGCGEAAAARAPMGAAREQWGQRLGRVGGFPPAGRLEAAGSAAGRAAGAQRGSGWAASPARRLRREPEPERSQSSDIRAPANTCERPPGPAGGGGARAPGWGRGQELRPPRLWATWAETRPCPGAAQPLLAWRRDKG